MRFGCPRFEINMLWVFYILNLGHRHLKKMSGCRFEHKHTLKGGTNHETRSPVREPMSAGC